MTVREDKAMGEEYKEVFYICITEEFGNVLKVGGFFCRAKRLFSMQITLFKAKKKCYRVNRVIDIVFTL